MSRPSLEQPFPASVEERIGRKFNPASRFLDEYFNSLDLADVPKSLKDTQKKYLGNLSKKVKETAPGKFIEGEGADAKVRLEIMRGAAAPGAEGPVNKVKDSQGNTYEPLPGGKWKVSDNKGNVVGNVDDVKVVGKGSDTEVIIKKGNTTTVLRTDGTSISDTRGDNGSRHTEVKDADGKLTKVIHNGMEFEFDKASGKFTRGKARGEIDPATGDLVFTNTDKSVTTRLKGDGTTVTRINGSHSEIVAFGDGSRIYSTYNDDTFTGGRKAQALKQADGTFIRIKENNKLAVFKDGKRDDEHELDGIEIDPARDIDGKTGKITLHNKPPGQNTEYYLSGNKAEFTPGPPPVLQNFTVTDSQGEKQQYTVATGFGMTIVSKDGIPLTVGGTGDVSIDPEKGTISVRDGTKVKTDHLGKGYSETVDAGELTEVSQNGRKWDVKLVDGKISEVKGGKTRYRIGEDNVKSIEINDGVITILNRDGSKIVQNIDGQTADYIPNGSSKPAMTMTFDKDGRMLAAESADKKHKYEFVRDAADPNSIKEIKLDGKIVPVPDEVTADSVKFKDGKPCILLAKDGLKIGEMTVDLSTESTTTHIGNKYTVRSPKGTVEIEMPDGKPTHVKVQDTAGKTLLEKDLPALPDGATVKSSQLTKEGKLTIQLEGADGKRTITVDPRTEQVITETEKEKTVQNKDSKVVIEHGPPKTAKVYGPDGKNLVYLARYDEKGHITRIENGKHEPLAATRHGGKIDLDENTGTFLSKKVGIETTYRPDGTSEQHRGDVTRYRDANGWLSGFKVGQQQTKFEYSEKEGQVETCDVNGRKRAVPDEITYPNHVQLQREDADEGDGDRKFVLTIPGRPPKVQKFERAWVDTNGVLYLADADGNVQKKIAPSGRDMTEGSRPGTQPSERRSRDGERDGPRETDYETIGGRTMPWRRGEMPYGMVPIEPTAPGVYCVRHSNGSQTYYDTANGMKVEVSADNRKVTCRAVVNGRLASATWRRNETDPNHARWICDDGRELNDFMLYAGARWSFESRFRH
jgi:hypothetical protein